MTVKYYQGGEAQYISRDLNNNPYLKKIDIEIMVETKLYYWIFYYVHPHRQELKQFYKKSKVSFVKPKKRITEKQFNDSKSSRY